MNYPLTSLYYRIDSLRASLRDQFTQGIAWNVLSLAILGCSGIVCNALIQIWRGPEALGVFNQVFAIYIIASQLAVGGLQFSTLKHCSHAQGNRDECGDILVTAFVLGIAGSAACTFAIFTARNPIGGLLGGDEVTVGLTMALPGLFFFPLNKILLMAVNAEQHMRAFAIFQSLRYLLILAGLVGIMFFEAPAGYLSLSLGLSELVLFVLLISYTQLRLYPWWRWPKHASGHWARRHLSFGSRGFMSGVLGEMNTRVDILMIGAALNNTAVGIYSLGAVFAEGYGMLSNVLRQNIDPAIGKAFANGQNGEIEKLGARLRQRFLPPMILVGLALMAGFPVLLWMLDRLGTAKVSWASWGVLSILVSGYVLASRYQPFIGLLLQGGRPGTFTVLLLFTVFGNFALNLLLIPSGGIHGAAMATAIVTILQGLCIGLLARRVFGVRI